MPINKLMKSALYLGTRSQCPAIYDIVAEDINYYTLFNSGPNNSFSKRLLLTLTLIVELIR
jgi:hypothetical protein